MSAAKRQASDSISSSNEVVLKRQKENGSALAVSGRPGGRDGALLQAVSLLPTPAQIPYILNTTNFPSP